MNEYLTKTLRQKSSSDEISGTVQDNVNTLGFPLEQQIRCVQHNNIPKSGFLH